VSATTNLVTEATTNSVIEHADALDWLAAQEPGTATAVIFDPPYAVGTPVRGREDGAAGPVSGPLSFMQRTMSLCARALRPGGIVIIFGDYKRLPDLMYGATTSRLRLSGCVAWVRTRPGTGGLFRSSWDPVLIASRGTPDAVDRAAVRNVIETEDVVYADYLAKRSHPYEKPPEVLGRILTRVCRRGDLVLDPFAGSGSSRVAAEKLGLDLIWRGCDIDPQFAETEPRREAEGGTGPAVRGALW
jgi:DNA modification methylase